MKKSFFASALLLLSVLSAAPAYAVFINGGISFTDGFDSTGTTTSIVSGLTFIDVSSPETASSCTGNFGPGTCTPNLGTFASDFTLGAPDQLVYLWNGFTFVANTFGTPTRVGLVCGALLANQCSDALLFTAQGTVTGPGFDPTGFLMSWTAQGSCTQAATGGNACGSSVTASWSASITATGARPGRELIPEPGSLALLGLAFGALGFSRRSKKA